MPQAPDFNALLEQISPPKLREYHRQGLAYIRETQAAFPIKQGMPEFVAWGAYFERTVGAFPGTYRMAMQDPQRYFTAPAQWPEWFDNRAALQITGQPQREAAE